jgi:hypothetical protein
VLLESIVVFRVAGRVTSARRPVILSDPYPTINAVSFTTRLICRELSRSL